MSRQFDAFSCIESAQETSVHDAATRRPVVSGFARGRATFKAVHEECSSGCMWCLQAAQELSKMFDQMAELYVWLINLFSFLSCATMDLIIGLFTNFGASLMLLQSWQGP